MVGRYVGLPTYNFDRMHVKINRHLETGAYMVRAGVIGKLGLHARPAMYFVERAADFAEVYGAEIKVAKLDRKGFIDTRVRGDGSIVGHVNGTSIMEIMMLAATKGTNIGISIAGEGDVVTYLNGIRGFMNQVKPAFVGEL